MTNDTRLRSGFTADGTLRVSNSTLKAVAECSTQVLVKGHGFTSGEERAELLAGNAVHEALAAYLSPVAAVLDEPMVVLEQEYRAWAEEHVASGDRLSWSNVERLIGAWLDAHPLATLPFTVKHVEIDFEFPLDDDGTITHIGRIDAIGEMRETGDVVIIDHKTTGNMSPYWLARFRMDSQISGYIRAAQEHLGGQRVAGAIINGIELKRLPDSTRKCDTHAVAYAECGHLHAKSQMIVVNRTPQQLVEWQKTAYHLARKYKDLLTRFPAIDDIHRVRQQGAFNGACRGCVAADWCAMDRPLDRLATVMVSHEERHAQ